MKKAIAFIVQQFLDVFDLLMKNLVNAKLIFIFLVKLYLKGLIQLYCLLLEHWFPLLKGINELINIEAF